MAAGTIKVSFAGSYKEAAAFAAANPPIKAPLALCHAGDDDGLPMLSLRFANNTQRAEAEALFTALGWPRWAQTLTVYQYDKRPPQVRL